MLRVATSLIALIAILLVSIAVLSALTTLAALTTLVRPILALARVTVARLFRIAWFFRHVTFSLRVSVA